jgi:hypothetical protein
VYLLQVVDPETILFDKFASLKHLKLNVIWRTLLKVWLRQRPISLMNLSLFPFPAIIKAKLIVARNKNMLLKLAGILVLIWVAGLIFHWLGKFINIALAVAVIFIIWHFVKSKKAT